MSRYSHYWQHGVTVERLAEIERVSVKFAKADFRQYCRRLCRECDAVREYTPSMTEQILAICGFRDASTKDIANEIKEDQVKVSNRARQIKLKGGLDVVAYHASSRGPDMPVYRRKW